MAVFPRNSCRNRFPAVFLGLIDKRLQFSASAERITVERFHFLRELGTLRSELLSFREAMRGDLRRSARLVSGAMSGYCAGGPTWTWTETENR